MAVGIRPETRLANDAHLEVERGIVVDDALQGVTEIVRGRDLMASTSVHRVLQALLLPAPITAGLLGLILGLMAFGSIAVAAASPASADRLSNTSRKRSSGCSMTRPATPPVR